jgi:hypothetical protein
MQLEQLKGETMHRNSTWIPLTAAVILAGLIPAAHAASAPALSAAQIIDRNVAARGGLAAWRSVKTLSMAGQMDAGGKKPTQLPFLMEMKRSNKVRVELQFNGQTAIQVYDGQHGWLVRPYLNRMDAEPYNAKQMERATEAADLDGPLIDYAAKGIKVDAEGVDSVEGHPAYKLKLTLKNGAVLHEWIDAQSFLEVKMQDLPRVMDGKPRDVETYYRDYRSTTGLMIPYVLETSVKGVAGTRKMTVEKVSVNPALDDTLFAKPALAVTAAKKG